MKVLSNRHYIIRKLGTHKSECAQYNRQRPFLPLDGMTVILVNRKRVLLDTDAVDDLDNFDANLFEI